MVWFEMSAGGCRFLLSQAGEDEDHLIFLKCGGQACAGEYLKGSPWADTWGPFLLSRAVESVKRAKKGHCHLLCPKNHREFWEIIFPSSVFPSGKAESAQNYLHFFFFKKVLELYSYPLCIMHQRNMFKCIFSVSLTEVLGSFVLGPKSWQMHPITTNLVALMFL